MKKTKECIAALALSATLLASAVAFGQSQCEVWVSGLAAYCEHNGLTGHGGVFTTWPKTINVWATGTAQSSVHSCWAKGKDVNGNTCETDHTQGSTLTDDCGANIVKVMVGCHDTSG